MSPGAARSGAADSAIRQAASAATGFSTDLIHEARTRRRIRLDFAMVDSGKGATARAGATVS